jgi:hypothetical protein
MLSTHRPPMTERDYLQEYLEFSRAISTQDLEVGRAMCLRMVTDGTRAERQQRAAVDGFVQSVECFVRELGYDPVLGDKADAFSEDLAIADPPKGRGGHPGQL